MLKIKVFKADDEDGINAFLASHVPATLSFRDSLLSISYDDLAPMGDGERAVLIHKQISLMEDKVLEAEVNYRLSLAEVTRQGRKAKQNLMDQHEGNRRNLEEQKSMRAVLVQLLKELRP